MSVGFNNTQRQSMVLSLGQTSLRLWKLMQRIPKNFRNVVVLIAAACSGIIFFLEDWQRDLTTNHAKLDKQAKNPLLRPVTLAMTPHAAAAMTKLWVKNRENWAVSSESSRDNNVTLELTRRTNFFGFIDDVRVEFRETTAGVRIDAESRSRIGKGDLGQNPRNLIELSELFIEMHHE